MARVYKTPVQQAAVMARPKLSGPFFDFEKDPTGDLLYKFVRSSGFGLIGNPINKNSYMIEDIDNGTRRMTRQQIIDELRERQRIDDEEDGDWFDFARDPNYEFRKEEDYADFGELNDFQADETWGKFKKRKGWK